MLISSLTPQKLQIQVYWFVAKRLKYKINIKQVKYSAKKVWQQGRIVNSSGFTRLKNAATVQNIKT